MHYFYIGNWKMFMDRASINCFLKAYVAEQSTCFQNNTVIMFPPACFLDYVHEQQKLIAQGNALKIGAQDCSQFSNGAYTGELSAHYLKETGCLYTIIGHTERRRLFHEDDQIVLVKAKNLIAVGIVPIIGVGPCEGNFSLADLCEYIKKQVSFFIQNVGACDEIFFAYEPYQAIGMHEIPTVQTITEICASIKMAVHNLKASVKVRVIYGGSVDERSIKILKTIQNIDGFLIGRASTDFQKLKNIISY